MWRFLAGVVATLLFVTAGFFIWKGQAGREASPIPPAPTDTMGNERLAFADIAEAPRADPKTKEQKRFNRYDKDKNGGVSRDEYMLSRRKAYMKLDLNGDGKLSFEEYAVKTVTKFAKADTDRTGSLNRTEFAATAVIRKNKPKPKCPPTLRAPQAVPVLPEPASVDQEEDT
jgi:uncharacterized protein YxeA